MPSDLTLLSGQLSRAPGELQPLMVAAQRVEALDRAMRQWCGEPWMKAIRVANLRGDTLVLYADSAAALLPLRYKREALLAHLRERHGLTATKLVAQVRPESRR